MVFDLSRFSCFEALCALLLVAVSLVGFSGTAFSNGILYDRYVHTIETSPGNFRDVVDVFALSGGSSTRLTTSPSDKEHDSSAAAWRSDGQKIAFYTARHRATTGNTSEIYVANADGSNPIRLTTNTNIDDDDPRWCGAGNTLIFTRIATKAEIYTMEAADTNSDGNGDQLTQVISGANDNISPDCSPDGTKVVFLRFVSNLDRKIVVADIDGSNEVVLTTAPARCGSPRWSPDGNWIAYSCTHHSGPMGMKEIYRMKPVDVMPQDGEGDDRERLTTSPSGSMATDPVWSPDNSMIAYTLSIGVINSGWQKTIGTNNDQPIPGLSGRTWPSDWR